MPEWHLLCLDLRTVFISFSKKAGERPRGSSHAQLSTTQLCALQLIQFRYLCLVVIDPILKYSIRHSAWTGVLVAKEIRSWIPGTFAPLDGYFVVSIRILEMMMNYMFISLVPVGSRYLHCLRETALPILIKIGWLISQYS